MLRIIRDVTAGEEIYVNYGIPVKSEEIEVDVGGNSRVSKEQVQVTGLRFALHTLPPTSCPTPSFFLSAVCLATVLVTLTGGTDMRMANNRAGSSCPALPTPR